jgi:putative transposase
LTHRQLSRSAKHHRAKTYIAHSPNQVWTWDISYLPTQVFGLYFYLYMIVDIYSRKIVGFSVHEQELSEHAASLITQAYLDENVEKNQVVGLLTENRRNFRPSEAYIKSPKFGFSRISSPNWQ